MRLEVWSRGSILLSLSLATSVAAWAAGGGTHDAVASSGSTYALSSDGVAALESAALDGDRIAAFRLYQYYAYSHYNTAKENKWLERAARLGHPVAQYNLAQRYLEDKDFRNAHHWAERLQSRDPKRAKHLLAEIKARQAANTPTPAPKPSSSKPAK